MFQSICSETLTIVIMTPAHKMRNVHRGSWSGSQSTSCSEVDISFPPRSIQLLPRDGSNIISFLEVLYGEANLKT